MSDSIFTTEKGHKIKCMVVTFRQTEVHLKQIHTIDMNATLVFSPLSLAKVNGNRERWPE